MMSFRRRHVACMKRSGEEGARCCTAQHESASSVFRGEGAHYPCRGGCAKTLVSQCLLHLSLVLLLDLNRAASGTRWKCQDGVTGIVLSKRGRDLHVARVMDLRSDRPSLNLFVQDCAPPAHGHSPFASRPLKWRGGRTGASDAYQMVCVVVEGRVPKAESFRMWTQGLSGAELIDTVHAIPMIVLGPTFNDATSCARN